MEGWYVTHGHLLLGKIFGLYRQGTTLESAGVDVSSSLWGSDLLLTDPKPIIDVHQGYIDAGADLVESSTYVIPLVELTKDTRYQSSQSYVNTLPSQRQKQKISYTPVYPSSHHHPPRTKS